LPAKDIKLSCDRYGKPKITDKIGQGLEFNLSHSGGYALCAITKNTPIGIDIEKIRARDPAHYVRVANRFFSESEAKVIRDAPKNEVVSLFFTCWTRKEAYVKQHGLGLRLPLRSFTVNVDYRKQARLENTPWHPTDVKVSQIYDLQVASGYCAAYSIASPKSISVQRYTKSAVNVT
jgi:4'-phosphopantetheinyl transferase